MNRRGRVPPPTLQPLVCVTHESSWVGGLQAVLGVRNHEEYGGMTTQARADTGSEHVVRPALARVVDGLHAGSGG